MVTLELTDYFLDKGFEVVVATNYYGQPISQEFDKRVEVVDFSSDIDINTFSHVWIHHNLIPWQILSHIETGKKINAKIAFHHMSPYLPIESPLAPKLEESIADYIFFNSQETKESYEYLFDDASRLYILGNPAPDKFLRDRNSEKNDKPRNILVVSNHVPTELTEALRSIEAKGINVDVFGVSGEPRLVTPSEILAHDVVISIGKTVQYSLLSGTPVYCYDHFGGSGYLSSNNLKKNRKFNFSGRGFSKKQSDSIAKEIEEGYATAVVEAAKLKNQYANEFLLSHKLADYINNEKTKKQIEDIKAEVPRQRVLMKMNIENIKAITYLRNKLLTIENNLDKKTIEVRELEGANARLNKSLVMRSPIKLIKIAFGKILNRD